MTLTKPQKCIYLRNGIELWVDSEKADRIIADLLQSPQNFIKVENRIINTKEIVGIFQPVDLDDLKRRKQGQWQCKKNNWHSREENCSCATEKVQFTPPEELTEEERQKAEEVRKEILGRLKTT